MSLILDALRRARPAARVDAPERRDAHADGVLATLGYGPVTPGSSRRAWIAAGLIAIGAAAAIGGGSILALRGAKYWRAAPQPPVAARAEKKPAPAAIAPPAPIAIAPSPPAERHEAETVVAAPPAPIVPAQKRSLPWLAARRPDGDAPAAAAPRQPPVWRPVQAEPARASAGISPGTSPANGARSDADHFKLALYYHRAGDFENALMHYRVLLQANELNAEVHNNLGLLYDTKGLAKEAIQEFQRAIFIEPQYAKARNNLGVAFLRAGRPDAAAAEFRAVLASESRNVDALVNLALALKAAGNSSEAQDVLLRALGVDARNASSHYNLALLYEENGDIEKAIQHYKSFLQHAAGEHSGIVPDVRTRIAALTSRLVHS